MDIHIVQKAKLDLPSANFNVRVATKNKHTSTKNNK